MKIQTNVYRRNKKMSFDNPEKRKAIEAALGQIENNSAKGLL